MDGAWLCELPHPLVAGGSPHGGLAVGRCGLWAGSWPSLYCCIPMPGIQLPFEDAFIRKNNRTCFIQHLLAWIITSKYVEVLRL